MFVLKIDSKLYAHYERIRFPLNSLDSTSVQFALLLEFANDLKFVARERKPQLYPITFITIQIIFLQTYST